MISLCQHIHCLCSYRVGLKLPLGFLRSHCHLELRPFAITSLVSLPKGNSYQREEKAPWELSVGQRIETASKMKEEGNILFKSGKYQRAGKKYDKAAYYVSEDGPFTNDEQKQVKSLRVQCWLNGAACNLKLNDIKEAIKLCSKALSRGSFDSSSQLY